MGYAVYEDRDNDRWAGYGVPAECDWTDCDERIDRGLGYKCEDHGHYVLMLEGEPIDYSRLRTEPDAEEVWTEAEGCGWFFCTEHLEHRNKYDHDTITTGKPDSAQWIAHMLTDETWEKWRSENPDAATRVRLSLTPRPGSAAFILGTTLADAKTYLEQLGAIGWEPASGRSLGRIQGRTVGAYLLTPAATEPDHSVAEGIRQAALLLRWKTGDRLGALRELHDRRRDNS